MRLFYFLFGLYGAAHIYIFICLRRAFGGGWWQLPAILWLAVMAGAWLARFGRPMGDWGEKIQNTTFVWMGFMILLCYCLLTLDLAALVLRLAAWITRSELTRRFADFMVAAKYVPAALGLAACLFGYALYEAQHPRIVEVALTSPKLAPHSPPLRIVAIADIHVSSLIGPWMLERMRQKVAETDPDILVISGDIVDIDVSARDKDAEILSRFPAKLAKIAVTGNHEDYRGMEQSLRFIRKAGFQVLRGEVTEVGGIAIGGVDDDRFAGRFAPDTADELRVVNMAPKDRFLLLLNHKPLYPQEAVGRFDLQFSGHTHGGQFWPGGMFTRKIYGAPQGMTTLTAQNGTVSRLFLTNGIGFWGPPIRFLTPPEVVVFTLRPEPENSPSSQVKAPAGRTASEVLPVPGIPAGQGASELPTTHMPLESREPAAAQKTSDASEIPAKG